MRTSKIIQMASRMRWDVRLLLLRKSSHSIDIINVIELSADLFYLIYTGVLPAYMAAPCVYCCSWRPGELELEMVVSHRVGVGNRI